ncbi:hypothetical protein [Cupriavidus basilensis]|uniref:hypothetical protein n=1 Tax=Cupriavidus basilensis TaxID=68895 RepID=UPI0039F6B5BB
MLDFHEGVTLHRPITAQYACADIHGADSMYCLDAPEAIPAGSTIRIEDQRMPPFAGPLRTWRD